MSLLEGLSRSLASQGAEAAEANVASSATGLVPNSAIHTAVMDALRPFEVNLGRGRAALAACVMEGGIADVVKKCQDAGTDDYKVKLEGEWLHQGRDAETMVELIACGQCLFVSLGERIKPFKMRAGDPAKAAAGNPSRVFAPICDPSRDIENDKQSGQKVPLELFDPTEMYKKWVGPEKLEQMLAKAAEGFWKYDYRHGVFVLEHTEPVDDDKRLELAAGKGRRFQKKNTWRDRLGRYQAGAFRGN